MFDYSDKAVEEQDPGPEEADFCIFDEALSDLSLRGLKVDEAAVARRNKRRNLRLTATQGTIRTDNKATTAQGTRRQGGRVVASGKMSIKPSFREPGRCTYKSVPLFLAGVLCSVHACGDCSFPCLR